MPAVAEQLSPVAWLAENGPEELEQLFRAVVYHPSAPILIADNDRQYRDASTGASRLLGLSREKLIGRKLDEFVEPALKPQMADLWQAFLHRGEQEGTLRLVGPDGPREVAYTVKGNVLPVRHLVFFRDTSDKSPGQGRRQIPFSEIPAGAQDCALFLLNAAGQVVTWYSGAERVYGYTSAEAFNRHISLLYPPGDSPVVDVNEELKKAAVGGHTGKEGWQLRKDGTRFWANAITMALRNSRGELQGFAVAVRDFSKRHDQNARLRKVQTRVPHSPADSAIAGVISGELDRIPEANDAFLELTGYTREDLLSGRLNWPDLTPPEYFAVDDLAHEECLRCGACTPFEKELIRKDGVRIPVLITTAVLKLSPLRWVSFVKDLRERDRREKIVEEAVELKHDFDEIVGRSADIRKMLGQIEVVAPTDATVLILGETGTGKELVARAVHRMSPRRDRTFVTLNCAAIPTGLLESELFGYERGAFTGALQQKIGRFEMAHRGTLFLDEVGDIPLDLQPKLLRALQEKAFERLGGTRTIPIDVRLVAATNRNLAQMMSEKLFRSDLYYRLKVFPVLTSPLRDHPEDIPHLAKHFTQKYARQMHKEIDRIPSDAMRALVTWTWPGNVRELENFIERSVILSPGTSLRVPFEEICAGAADSNGTSTLDQVEREHVVRVLRETGGVISKAAIRLGMPRTTLNAVMRKLGISAKEL
jgi:formate hydrogenlyase transcriptional activator